jgi:DNA-binding PadR family transcriptional regulator
MRFLSRKEELLLLAIWRLQDGAYGVAIRKHVSKVTGKYWSIGAIYDVLDRLTRKKLVSTQTSEPIKARGGKSRKYFQVTKQGFQALREIKRLQEKTWADLPQMVKEKT